MHARASWRAVLCVSGGELLGGLRAAGAGYALHDGLFRLCAALWAAQLVGTDSLIKTADRRGLCQIEAYTKIYRLTMYTNLF